MAEQDGVKGNVIEIFTEATYFYHYNQWKERHVYFPELCPLAQIYCHWHTTMIEREGSIVKPLSHNYLPAQSVVTRMHFIINLEQGQLKIS